jgi:DNA-directed RNA polymerase subunit M/transcription elongation factor TFIIS
MKNFLKCPHCGEHTIEYIITEMSSSEVIIEVFCTEKNCKFHKEKTILIEDFLIF